MKQITIDYTEDGWKITQGDGYKDNLTFDEMLGTIAAITFPVPRLYKRSLRTKEEHEAFYKSLKLTPGFVDKMLSEVTEDAKTYEPAINR